MHTVTIYTLGPVLAADNIESNNESFEDASDDDDFLDIDRVESNLDDALEDDKEGTSFNFRDEPETFEEDDETDCQVADLDDEELNDLFLQDMCESDDDDDYDELYSSSDDAPAGVFQIEQGKKDASVHLRP
jgi:hypothetical protein